MLGISRCWMVVVGIAPGELRQMEEPIRRKPKGA